MSDELAQPPGIEADQDEVHPGRNTIDPERAPQRTPPIGTALSLLWWLEEAPRASR
jgi:hypothetical protein